MILFVGGSLLILLIIALAGRSILRIIEGFGKLILVFLFLAMIASALFGSDIFFDILDAFDSMITIETTIETV